MRVYVGHVSGVFDASYWSAGFGTFFQVSPHASRWLGTVQIVRQRRRKMTSTPPITFNAIQATSQSTFYQCTIILHL